MALFFYVFLLPSFVRFDTEVMIISKDSKDYKHLILPLCIFFIQSLFQYISCSLTVTLIVRYVKRYMISIAVENEKTVLLVRMPILSQSCPYTCIDQILLNRCSPPPSPPPLLLGFKKVMTTKFETKYFYEIQLQIKYILQMLAIFSETEKVIQSPHDF